MFTSSKYVVATSLLSAAVTLSLCGCGGSPDGSTTEGAALAAPAFSSLDTTSWRAASKLPSATLAVPAGNELEFLFDAIGVQIYACQATATGFGWVFQAPEATLFDRHGRVAGKHYAGPTWESVDKSKVVGAKIAAFTVEPTSIPWLLLQVASHAGDGRMSEVTYIQRLKTTGGVAPGAGCDGAHVGDIARVDYTAKYYFYEGSPAAR